MSGPDLLLQVVNYRLLVAIATVLALALVAMPLAGMGCQNSVETATRIPLWGSGRDPALEAILRYKDPGR